MPITGFKKTTAFLLSLALLAGAGGCSAGQVLGSGPAPAFTAPDEVPAVGPSPVRLLFTLPALTNDCGVQLARGVQDGCDTYGIVVEMDASADMAAQEAVIAEFTATGGSAVVCAPANAGHLAAVLQSALDAGLVVVGTDEALAPVGAVIGWSLYGLGQSLGEKAAAFLLATEEAGESTPAPADGQAAPTVCVVEYAASAGPDGPGAGIAAGIAARAPNARVTRIAVENAAEAGDAVRRQLEDAPDTRLVLGVDDTLGLAAMRAVATAETDDAGAAGSREDAAVPGGDGAADGLPALLFGGMGATDGAVEAILGGAGYVTLDSGAYATGLLLVETANALIKGENAPAAQTAQTVLISRENAAQYI